MKTVLITGCSSGYGLETARHFHARGWNVVATMRTPRDRRPAPVRTASRARLDVTKPESIAAALEASGPIDVLVNNAGIGGFGAFEATPMDTAREIFETNTFGVMAMTQAVLPGFRERRSGVIVNVTSSATLAAMPLVAVYTASKTAIEGFTASLALELEEFGVSVKLVEPGHCPSDAVHEQHRVAHRRADPRALCAVRAARPGRLRQPGGGDERARRGRGGLARRQRCLRTAPIPRGPRRRRAGRGGVGDDGLPRSATRRQPRRRARRLPPPRPRPVASRERGSSPREAGRSAPTAGRRRSGRRSSPR